MQRKKVRSLESSIRTLDSDISSSRVSSLSMQRDDVDAVVTGAGYSAPISSRVAA